MMIILLLFIAFLIYTQVNQNGQPAFGTRRSSGDSEALDIAKDRLSTGEI